MSRIFKLIIGMLGISILFLGCGTLTNSEVGEKGTPTIITDYPVEEVTFKAEVMEAGKGLLVSPDPKSDEYKSSDKISVNVLDSTIKDDTGNLIILTELKAGDIIEITYNGTILESYPAQIGASKIDVIDHNTLIDGYLAIIDDIYQVDQGLNGGMIAVDTTGWIEITDIEKEIIITKLKEIYGVEIKEATYDELVTEGLIDDKNLYFEKGILITISNMKYDKDKNKITYSIVKWKGGLGADGSDDATAKYNGSEWKITKKNSWIS